MSVSILTEKRKKELKSVLCGRSLKNIRRISTNICCLRVKEIELLYSISEHTGLEDSHFHFKPNQFVLQYETIIVTVLPC